MRKSKRKLTSLVALSLVTVITSIFLSSCGLMPTEEAELLPPITDPKKIEYKTQKVELGDIEKIVTASANVVSETQYNLSFEYRGGYLKAVHFGEGEFVKKGEIIAELDNDSLLNQIERQKLILRRAEVAYSEQYNSADRMTRTNADINLQLERLTLKDLESELKKSKIIAPCDGNIIMLSNYAIGEWVGARSIICRFADPDKLRVVCNDDGKSKFALEDNVTVTYKDTVIEAKVVMTPWAVAEDLGEEFKGKLVIDMGKKMPEDFKLGTSVTIKLLVDSQKDVVVIPTNTVKLYGGKKYVKVLEDGLKVERIIETGIENGTQTQVISGLEVGEDLITN